MNMAGPSKVRCPPDHEVVIETDELTLIRETRGNDEDA